MRRHNILVLNKLTESMFYAMKIGICYRNAKITLRMCYVLLNVRSSKVFSARPRIRVWQEVI